jgi:hypothetical protein
LTCRAQAVMATNDHRAERAVRLKITQYHRSIWVVKTALP